MGRRFRQAYDKQSSGTPSSLHSHDLKSLIMDQRGFRFRPLSVCCVLLSAAITPHFLSAEKPKAIPREEIDRLVIAALLRQGVTKPKVVSHIDLTEPFGTETQWTFVAIQDGGQPPTELEDHGPIFLCLVKASSPDCALHFYQHVRNDMPWADTPYHLFASSIVYGGENKTRPFLFAQVCGAGAMSGDGDCGIANALYRYDKGADRFIRVFLNRTGRNNNQDTRFVESGPLQGDVIVGNPTENAPYTYWIEVYRAGDSGQYGRVLRYRGLTGYSDGNPLAVADSEMPEILHRLGIVATRRSFACSGPSASGMQSFVYAAWRRMVQVMSRGGLHVSHTRPPMWSAFEKWGTQVNGMSDVGHLPYRPDPATNKRRRGCHFHWRRWLHLGRA